MSARSGAMAARGAGRRKCGRARAACALGAVAEALPGADVVHFGHEADAGFVLRKLYLEYAARARARMARWATRRWPISPSNGARIPARRALTRYIWRPCGSRRRPGRGSRTASAGPRARAAALRLLDERGGARRP